MLLSGYLKLFCKANTLVDIKKVWRHVPYLDVGQHAKNRPHIQAHLVLPTHIANAKNQKSLNFCQRSTGN